MNADQSPLGHGSRNFDRHIERLFTNPDVKQIVIGDPRFRWLLQRWLGLFNVEMTLGEAVGQLISSSAVEDSEVETFLIDLVEYTNELDNDSLENELIGILAPLIRDTHQFDSIMRWFGWMGAEPLSLDDAANSIGASRAQFLQILERIELDLQLQAVWAPVLDRAISVTRRQAPMPIENVGSVLSRAGLTASINFDGKGLLRAHEIFHREPRIQLSIYNDWDFIIRTGEAPHLNSFLKTRKLIEKHIINQGMVDIEAFVAQLGNSGLGLMEVRQAALMVDEWMLVDERWIIPRDMDSQNPLFNRIQKVLAIAPRCPLILMHVQLLREDRPSRQLHLSVDGLRVFVHHHPDMDMLPNDLVSNTSPLWASDVLSEAEQVILTTFRADNWELNYSTLIEAMESKSISRVNAELTLLTSPIVQRRGHNSYSLLSTQLEEINSAKVVLPSANASTTGNRARTGKTTAVRIADDPIATLDPSRNMIVETAHRLLMVEGCSTLTQLRIALSTKKVTAYSRSVLEATLIGDNYVMLDDEWFTSFSPNIGNHLQLLATALHARGKPIDADALRTRGITLPIEPLKLFVAEWRRRNYQSDDGTSILEEPTPSIAVTDQFMGKTRHSASISKGDLHTAQVPVLSEDRPDRIAEMPLRVTIVKPVPPSVGDEIRLAARKVVEKDGCGHRATLNAKLRGRKIECDRAVLDEVLNATAYIVNLDSEWFTIFEPEVKNPLQMIVADVRGSGRRASSTSLSSNGSMLSSRVLRQFIEVLEAFESQTPGILSVQVPESASRLESFHSLAERSRAERDQATGYGSTGKDPLGHDLNRSLDGARHRLIGEGDEDFPEGLSGNIQRMVTRYGVVHINDVYMRFTPTSKGTIDTKVAKLQDAGYELIDGAFLTIFDPAYHNRLTNRLRRLLAVFNAGCGLEQAREQLCRNPESFPEIALSTLRAFVDKHPEFRLVENHIRPTRPYKLNDPELFQDAELELQRIFADSQSHVMSHDEIMARFDPKTTMPEHVELQIKNSVIIRRGPGDDKFELVAQSIASNYQKPLLRRRRGEANPQSVASPAKSTLPPRSVETANLGVPEKGPRRVLPIQPIAFPAARQTSPAINETIVSEPEILVRSPVERGQVAPPPSSVPPLPSASVAPFPTRAAASPLLSTALVPLRDLITDLHDGFITVPEFQREYVWKPTQVCGLFDSLYRGYPIGGMLLWDTDEEVMIRTTGDIGRQGRPRERHLMDGQQRLTSLVRMVHPDSLNSNAESEVLFDLVGETFIRATAMAKRSATNVDVALALRLTPTELLKQAGFEQHTKRAEFVTALCRLQRCFDQPIPVSTLKDFSFEEVVDVFSRVNSQGTRLKKVELLRADLAQRLPGLISLQIQNYEAQLRARGWQIEHQLLLHMLTAVTTGRGDENMLARAGVDDIRAGWKRTAGALESFLALLESYGIRSLDWVASMNALVTPVAYLASTTIVDRNPRHLMRWFFLALAKQRYNDGAKGKVDQEVNILSTMGEKALPHLFGILQTAYGRLEIRDDEVGSVLDNGRLTLLMYSAMRHAGAVDLQNEQRIETQPSTIGQGLVVHKIFSARAVGARSSRSLANTALLVEPWKYDYPKLAFEHVSAKRLQAQFIPDYSELWKTINFKAFQAERQRLLAVGMNTFLGSLQD